MKYLLLLIGVCAAPLGACLWDTDTLAQESAGMPDVKVVIVGGFARNPDLYYEMRLERVSKLLAEDADNLEAYDDAGVACSRLGRNDEAIEWMEKKKAAMDRMGYAETEQPNHHYRYCANLGTFYVHRWFQDGATMDALVDLEAGRDLSAQALEENPDAHFGREKYQLKFIDWVLTKPHYYDESDPAKEAGQRRGWIPNFLDLGKTDRFMPSTSDNDHLKEMGLEDAITGLCGLITLGAAWESVDAFYTLALLLQIDGRSAFAYFALLRVKELLEDGKHFFASEVPLTPEGITDAEFSFLRFPTKDKSGATAEFLALRRKADEWQDARAEYVVTRMLEGRHPDTDSDFWDDFEGDPERMEVPAGAIYGAGGAVNAVLQSDWFWILMIFVGGSFLMILYYIYSKRRNRRLATTRYSH